MENLVLYRKYRPKTFSEIVGQEHIVRTLTNALALNKVAHAYLFAGPRGTGKTTIARLLAKAVNCAIRNSQAKLGDEKSQSSATLRSATPNYEPCNQCSACQEINNGRCLDLIEIDAASNRGIDEIRELRDGIKFSPNRLKYKVFVVDECLTEDHFITMADGRVKKISEIRDGERVVSIDMGIGRIVKRPIKNWFKRKTDQIIEIKIPHTFLKCTPTHRLWIVRDSQFLLTKAQDLKIGDFLLSPVYLPHIQKNNFTPAQLSLLASVQCDGHMSKDSITVQIEIQKDKDYFQKIVEEGLKAWQIKEKPVIKKTSRGTRLIRIYSKKLKEILTNLGCPSGKKTTKIDIPDIVFQAPLESIKAYIDTCFCCEGNIDFNKSLCLYRLNFNSGSEVFVKKLQLLLKKFGISSGFLIIPKKGENNKNRSILYRLHLSHYDLRIFHQKIGLFLKRKADILAKCALSKSKIKQDTIPIEGIVIEEQKEKKVPYSELVSLGIWPDLRQHLSRRAVVNFMKVGGVSKLNRYLQFRYEKVKKIKILNKKEQVYDFTVEGTHNFIANGMVSSNCHMMTREAFNALLKTLEEPPSHAIFVLATTEVHKVPQTIISRCQRFDFHKLPLEKIAQRLAQIAEQEKVKIEKPALHLIALNADGSMRDGESLLGQIMAMEDKNITLEEVQTILGVTDIGAVQDLVNYLGEKQISQAISHINQVFDQGYDPTQFTKSLINYLRKMLVLKVDSQLVNLVAPELTKEQLETIINQGQRFSETDLTKLIRLFIQTENEIRFSSFPQLPLELAVVECCGDKSR